MGLDQWATVRPEGMGEDKEIRVFSWRKHPNLQGWMERLWRERGGTGDFNQPESVELRVDDLVALEKAVTDSNLPQTVGFFFGQDSDEEYICDDLQFIGRARDAITSGHRVFYASWW